MSTFTKVFLIVQLAGWVLFYLGACFVYWGIKSPTYIAHPDAEYLRFFMVWYAVLTTTAALGIASAVTNEGGE